MLVNIRASHCCSLSIPDLLAAYCQWIPEVMHDDVAKQWPPVAV